jgi:hypothetical protein
MQNEDEQLKTTGEGEKVTWSRKARLWLSAVVEGGGDSGGVFLPSLLSSVSLLSPLFSVFFFFVIFSFSPLSLRGCQRRLDMAVSVAVRWFAVAVERKHDGSCSCSSSLVYIFFFCHSPFSPLLLLFPLLYVSVSLYILQFLMVIVWLLTVAAGGVNWGELRVADDFFYVFLALCFCSPVALAYAAPSSVSDDGGAAVVGGAAGWWPKATVEREEQLLGT